jgi:DNA-binding PadR family transcriptional regulator
MYFNVPAGGPRARRGDVRAAILALLAEEPRNGYQIIQELSERTEGVWQPSPGSVYPALQQLEDEGLVRTVEVEGRKAYELTDEGRAHVEEHKDEIGAPWETIVESAPGGEAELRDLGRQLFVALMQVSHAGSEAQVQEAKAVLADARKAIYRILANGED